MHSSLSSVAQFWQAALVGRERLVGGDVGHLLLLAVHHLLDHLSRPHLLLVGLHRASGHWPAPFPSPAAQRPQVVNTESEDDYDNK